MATVTEGRENVAKLIGAGISADSHGSVAIGTDSTAVSDSDSGLITTLDEFTGGNLVSRNGSTVSVVGTFTGNSASVREASVYADTNTVLLARQVISTVNVQDSDTLEVTWDINVS